MLVSLITTVVPVAGNDWNLNKSPVDETNKVLCRSPLVRRDPGERFLVTTVMAGWAAGENFAA